jgi:hypothetical protein
MLVRPPEKDKPRAGLSASSGFIFSERILLFEGQGLRLLNLSFRGALATRNLRLTRFVRDIDFSLRSK